HPRDRTVLAEQRVLTHDVRERFGPQPLRQRRGRRDGEEVGAASLLAAGVRQLEAAGAKNIVVFTVPNTATTPSTLDSVAAADTPQEAAAIAIGAEQLGIAYNDALESALSRTNAVLFDLGKLTDAALAEPGRFGFTQTGQVQDGDGVLEGVACPTSSDPEVNSLVCLEGVTAFPEEDDVFLFADGVHPTAEGHAIIAQALQSLFVSANDTARTMETMLTVQRQRELWREERLRPSALYTLSPEGGWVKRADGDVQARIVGGYNSAEGDALDPLYSSGEGDEVSGTLAIDALVGQSSLFGGEVGVHSGEVDFTNSNASWTSVHAGLFGMSAFSEYFHLNGALGVEVVYFDDIERSVTLGAARETYSGDTEAFRFYARAGLGATIPLSESATLTPDAAISFNRMDLEAYEEDDGPASFAYGDNEIQSTRGILGLTLAAAPQSLPGWGFSLRGAYEHEFDDERHEIEIGSDEGKLGVLTLERIDDSYAVVSGRITRAVGATGALSLGAATTLPEEGETGYAGSIEFSLGF
ncbi:MAG: autotransporter domain-containing protein, partial [Pseudomonadota bacterium]